eukprot:5883152-Pyramimonas_sp.AAC.1
MELLPGQGTRAPDRRLLRMCACWLVWWVCYLAAVLIFKVGLEVTLPVMGVEINITYRWVPSLYVPPQDNEANVTLFMSSKLPAPILKPAIVSAAPGRNPGVDIQVGCIVDCFLTVVKGPRFGTLQQ